MSEKATLLGTAVPLQPGDAFYVARPGLPLGEPLQITADELRSAMGGSGTFATRAAMAARDPAAVGDTVQLTENNRQGFFRVELASDWTAQIAADTAQERFVASTADATKVYRRIGFGGNVKFAGAVGDYNIDTQAGTDDAPAIRAGLADIKSDAIHFAGIGYSTGGDRYDVPKPKKSYFLGSTLDITATIRMQGPGTGQAGGMSTIFYVDDNMTAFRFQAGNTVGEAATYTPTVVEGANGSIFGGFAVIGRGFNGTTRLDNLSARAFHMRAGVSLRDFQVWRMQGPAVEIRAGVGSAELGNANCWEVTSCWVQECLYGIKTSLSDSNAGICLHAKFSGIRRWAIEDISGAANMYIAPLTQLCGVFGDGTVNNPTSTCHQAGVLYGVRAGQEAWASVNAPPAGHNDNTGWIWYEDGVAGTGGAPPVDWFNGMHLVAGGPYRLVNGGTVLGAYWEGNQPPSQCGGGTLFMGGTWGGVRPYPIGAAWINAGSGNVAVNALEVYTGGISMRDDQSGGLVVGRYTPGNPGFVSTTAAQMAFGVPGVQAQLLSSSEIDFFPYSGHGWYLASGTGNFAPFTDNDSEIGNSGHRVKNIYLVNAPIVTSDRQHKTAVRKLADKEFDALLDAVGAVPLLAFKFRHAVRVKGKAHARDHYGIIAQDLHDELVKRGLDPFAGGVLGCDVVLEEIEDEVEVEQEAMSTIMEPKETVEIVDGKAVRRVELVEKQVPDFDYVQLHDEHGKPIVRPAQPEQRFYLPIIDEEGNARQLNEDDKRFRKAKRGKYVEDPDGPLVETVRPEIPEQPVRHPVRRMEKVKVKMPRQSVKLDANGDEEFIWNVRYAELATLQFAWMQRELARAAAKGK